MLMTALVGLPVGCREKTAQSAARPVVPVTVATALQKDVPIEVRAIANIEPYATVSIKAQVAGEITGVFFREGEDVSKGQLLFTIDRRPFEAELASAEARLARDAAQLKNAEAQAARYARLMQEGVVAREQYDQFNTEKEALEAAVRADRAEVENARVRLAYTSIRAPISGRAGSLMLHKGNLVKANDDPPLVVLNQLQPIYVNFAVPEEHLPEVKHHIAVGRKLRVEAHVPNETATEKGVLTFVDNAVDRTTGTIRLKGTFANPQKRLWPGQFVNAVLRLAEQQDAVVVPSQAVQTGQQGQYVFIVKRDKTAEYRQVIVTRATENEAVIEKGLQPGETVVTDGHLRLVPGATVEIKQAAASPAGSP